MHTIVCTLFEGDYHYGVAALVNSMYKYGFRGDVFAGYRGQLPKWANKAMPNATLRWPNSSTLTVNEELRIHFLPLITTYHLANYKPDFMLALLDGPAKKVEGIFYFDPDIVIKCKWSFFEEWISYGVAVVQEITANNVSENHPKRVRWEKVILKCNRNVERKLNYYFNSGFCGLRTHDYDFLEAWQNIITMGIKEFGFDINCFSKEIVQTSVFPVGDQDAFNAATMCSKPKISDFGPEGMDFVHGGWLMSHATGKPKPWGTNFLLKSLKSQQITISEKNYWKNVNEVIHTHSNYCVLFNRIMLKIGSLVNRFYLRS